MYRELHAAGAWARSRARSLTWAGTGTWARAATRAATRAAARARTVLLVAMVAGGLAACGAPHPPISNGSVSACYRALPTAEQAVHDPRARLLGVHRVPADQVRAGALRSGVSLPSADQDTIVCVVAFQGTFHAGQVTAAKAGAAGRYAVVLVTSRHLKILTSFVGDRLPRSLRGHLVL